jgi:hypothetical protein
MKVLLDLGREISYGGNTVQDKCSNAIMQLFGYLKPELGIKLISLHEIALYGSNLWQDDYLGYFFCNTNLVSCESLTIT